MSYAHNTLESTIVDNNLLGLRIIVLGGLVLCNAVLCKVPTISKDKFPLKGQINKINQTIQLSK